MPSKQLDGRVLTAEWLSQQPLHLAWGAGNPAWDDVPSPEPVDATALVAELGRRTVTQVGFVVPNVDGQIETPQGNYALSGVPTRWLYVRTVFAFNEEPTARIRELGLFVGTEVAGGLPPGQRYFTPAQVTDPGRLYLLDRGQNLIRNGSVRPAFEYVLPF